VERQERAGAGIRLTLLPELPPVLSRYLFRNNGFGGLCCRSRTGGCSRFRNRLRRFAGLPGSVRTSSCTRIS